VRKPRGRATLIERDDATLFRKCRERVVGSRLAWIQLDTAPGRGNTTLLRRVEQFAARDATLRLSTQTIFVEGRPARRDDFTPIGRALMSAPMSSFRRRIAELRRTPLAQHLRTVGVLLTLLLAGVLVAPMIPYWTERENATFSGYVDLITHYPHPVSVFVATFITAFVFDLLLRFFRREQRELEKEKVAEELQTLERLSETVAALGGGRDAILILIDDVQQLPASDQEFLRALFSRVSIAEEIDELRERYKIFVVSAEPGWWADVKEVAAGNIDVVRVRPFKLVEAREIVAALAPELLTGPQEAQEEILQSAQQNINIVNKKRYEQLAQEMGTLLSQIRGLELDADRITLDTLMSLAAVRFSSPVDPPLDVTTKKEIVSWINEISACPLLKTIGLDRPTDVDSLADRIAETRLVIGRQRQLRIDHARAQALVSWLAANHAAELAKTHVLWFGHAVGRIATTPPIQESSGDAQLLKAAAWHIREAAQLIPDRQQLVPEVGVRYQIGATLLRAASVLRLEGDLQNANASLAGAVRWSDNVAAVAIAQMWEHYWLSGDVDLRRQIESLTKEANVDTPSLRLNKAHEQLMIAPGVPPEVVLSGDEAPEIRVRKSYHDLIAAARTSRGFVFDFSDAPVPPSFDPTPSAAATSFRYAICRSLIARKEHATAHAALDAWRAAGGSRPAGGHIGEEALHWFDRGARLHCSAALAKSESETYASDYEDATRSYERALLLMTLLQWRVAALALNFFLGVIGQERTPPDGRSDSEEWSRWEPHFANCLWIERDLKWLFYTPEVHRLRWIFFEDVARDFSLEDGYNTFCAARDAGFPTGVLLGIHQQVASMLTNYGDKEADRLRDAELHKAWANDLAAKPEAHSAWTFDSLEAEQANALNFASQAVRLAGKIEEAAALLAEADAHFARVAQTEKRYQYLASTLKIGRILLHIAENKTAARDAAILDLWQTVEPDEYRFADALVTRVGLEAEQGLLSEPWPVPPNDDPGRDPDNDKLSLPPEWMGDGSHPITNRFDFRFWQLRMALESTSPGAWEGIATSILKLGSIGIEDEKIGATYAPLMQTLLIARGYYARVEKVEGSELEALRLLVAGDRSSPQLRSEYLDAFERYQELLTRELQMIAGSPGNWFALADRIHHFFYILVEPTTLADRKAAAFARDGLSAKQFEEIVDARRGALSSAKAALEGNDTDSCIAIIGPVLPDGRQSWVLWEDLRLLDLWLRAANHAGVEASAIDQRSLQLRDMTMRYIRQLSEVINDEQVDTLTLRLQKVLEEVHLHGQRIPIRAPKQPSAASPRRPPAPPPALTDYAS